jgi:hypothetical protein
MVTEKTVKLILKIGVLLAFGVLMIVYGIHNPETSTNFPRCPFRLLTGYLCPGCGSQRALHYILNMQLNKSLMANALLVYSIPVIIFLFFIESFKTKSVLAQKLYAVFFHSIFILIYLGIIIVWWIFRNIC